MDSPLALTEAIARAVSGAGGRALIVGGWVRDHLMGREAKDIDLEVYGLPAEQLLAVLGRFGRVSTVGEAFTVYKVGAIDVALPRRESKSGHGHRGFQVTGDPAMTFAEAARRRDFTINAMGWDPLTDEYLDPHAGRADIARGVLRAVDPDTFGDDSLRVLRAVQFAARFEFSLDETTRAICQRLSLDDLPAERIWGEIEKLLLEARRPSIGFQLALDLGVVDRLFPDLAALVGCPQEPEWHPEGDVWVHTLLVVDQARLRIDDLPRPQALAMMLGAVCHDLGKPATTAVVEGRIRSYNHEPEGVAPATRLLDRLKVHTIDGFDVRREVLGMTAHHLKPGMFYNARETLGDGAFRRLAQRADLELLGRLASADCNGRGGGFDCTAMDWFRERARLLGVEHAAPAPLLKGRHLIALGVRPGPGMGRIIQLVYERQLEGEIKTEADAIAAAEAIVAASKS